MTLVVTPGGDLVGLVSTYGPDGNPVGKAKANGWQGVTLVRSSDGTEVNIGTNGDGINTLTNLISADARNVVFNGATWDRQRGNTEGTLLASAARTAQTASPIQTNYNARGLQLYLVVTAASGTGGLQLRLRFYDPVTGNYVTQLTPVAITATGTTMYEFCPGVSGANKVNTTVPRSWGVDVQVGDASSYTYSVGYALIV